MKLKSLGAYVNSYTYPQELLQDFIDSIF